jgi:hypothetical protein
LDRTRRRCDHADLAIARTCRSITSVGGDVRDG